MDPDKRIEFHLPDGGRRLTLKSLVTNWSYHLIFNNYENKLNEAKELITL